MSKTVSINAHFDGKSFVPDEPVNISPGEAVVLDIHKTANPKIEQEITEPTLSPKFKTADERKAALQRVIEMMQGLPEIPLEALRRENMYADDKY